MTFPLGAREHALPRSLILAVAVAQSSPQQINPATLLLWVLGLPGGLALLTLIAKGIFFIGKASSKLDQWDTVVAEFREHRHIFRNYAQSVDLSLMIVENDVNSLQQHLDLPVRAFPDRRVGPADRRQTSQ